MLDSIITSKTRIKLLLKFFLNCQTKSYLRHLEQEFGESSNAIRVELNRLEEAGLLESEHSGNRKYFFANTQHPLFPDIHNILKKFVGIDQLIEKVTSQIGDLEAAYITGDFAQGRNSQIIDLVLVGQNLDTVYVNKLIQKTQEIIERKVRPLILTTNQMKDYFHNKPILLIWKENIELNQLH
jgi:predicted transcriptional regulator